MPDLLSPFFSTFTFVQQGHFICMVAIAANLTNQLLSDITKNRIASK
jgi:hypothetical protein